MADVKRILIVEDEKPLLDSYAESVETAGYVPLKASDGYQALDILSNNLDQIDLVLLDLMMPGVDGLEVLKTVRNNEDKSIDNPLVSGGFNASPIVVEFEDNVYVPGIF